MTIKALQSDSRMDFRALENLSFQGGYTRRISCSYTPTQNGVMERKIVMLLKPVFLFLQELVYPFPIRNFFSNMQLIDQ